jgi:hypothetical protein
LRSNKNDILLKNPLLVVDFLPQSFEFQRVIGGFEGLGAGLVGVAVRLDFLVDFVAEDELVDLLRELVEVGGDDESHGFFLGEFQVLSFDEVGDLNAFDAGK